MNSNSTNLQSIWRYMESGRSFNLSVMQNDCYPNSTALWHSPVHGNGQRNFFNSIDIPLTSLTPINISQSNPIMINDGTIGVCYDNKDGRINNENLKKINVSSAVDNFSNNIKISDKAGEKKVNIFKSDEILNKSIICPEKIETLPTTRSNITSLPIFPPPSKIEVSGRINNNFNINKSLQPPINPNQSSETMLHSIETTSIPSILNSSHYFDSPTYGYTTTPQYDINNQTTINDISNNHKITFNNLLSTNNMANLYSNIPFINDSNNLYGNNYYNMRRQLPNMGQGFESNIPVNVFPMNNNNSNSMPKYFNDYNNERTIENWNQKNVPSLQNDNLDSDNISQGILKDFRERNLIKDDGTKSEPLSPKALCSVCLNAPSNGLHFGAKACAACAAFFRRSICDNKKYICKKSQRCLITAISDTGGYRKMCRECRMRRCLSVGMQPSNVQNRKHVHLIMPRKDMLGTGSRICYENIKHDADNCGAIIVGLVIQNVNQFKNIFIVSSYSLEVLRLTAVIFVLTRTAININVNKIKKHWKKSFVLSVPPTIFGCISITLVTYYIFKMPLKISLAYAFIIGASGPMIPTFMSEYLTNKSLGLQSGICEIWKLTTSIDNILCLIFLNITMDIGFQETNQNPLDVCSHIGIGIGIGIALGIIFWYFPFNKTSQSLPLIRVLMIISSGGAALFYFNIINYTSTALFCILISSFVAGIRFKRDSILGIKPNEQVYLDNLWNYIFEPYLFFITGYHCNFSNFVPETFIFCFIIIAFATISKIIFALLSTLFLTLTRGEKIFLSLSSIPRAAIQAANTIMILNLSQNSEISEDGKILHLTVVVSLIVPPILCQWIYAYMGGKLLKRFTVNDLNIQNVTVVEDKNSIPKYT
uniref:Nuclear receptor domain-containing protein n=1 Tax=Parastrongyloides trichosuri TaxID=131310 RepID=A0A0N5A4R2_PARTI